MKREEVENGGTYVTWWGGRLRIKGPARGCSGLEGSQTGTMELSMLLLLVLLMGLLLLLVRGHPKAYGHLPPGPRPLPFLGNLLQMDRRGLLKSFLKLQEKYGDVFTVYLGPRPTVMLCGTEAIREALVDQAEAFSGRGKIAVVDQVFQGYGVVFANGERWKTLRRFSLATMRNFGMGKRSVEERIQEEAQFLMEELRNTKGALQDPTFFFHAITANIICSIVFGKRFSFRDPEFLRLLDLFYRSFALISSFSSQVFQLFSDFLKHFPGTHRQVYRNLMEINTFIGRSVEEHRKTLDPSNPRDLIDTYLLRMDKKSDPNTEFHQQNLIITVLSLFFAGTETTSTTLRYGFLLMLKYPHITERVHKEIDLVIGSQRPPALDDRTKMPYTDAVIHEIQRFSDLLPLGVPHVVTNDTHFRGYIIPKGTEVYPILSSALHDPRYFEKPDAFNPDHFLDASGALKKNEAFIPFSTGKRTCLGEGIARTELFLFFTTILQNFSVASPVAPEDIDLTPRESGVGRIPPIYQISFLPHHGG
uniref:Cytochrome P450 family 2 subfamily B member 6 n=1 Tax=Equus caballus TaxID=9796 RepID=F6R4L7_HORSE